MKKIIALLVLVLGIFVGAIVFFSVYQYDKVNFGKELMMYSDSTADEYNVILDYKGESCQLQGAEKAKVYQVLIRGSSIRKRVLFDHDYDLKSMTFTFGDTAKITVAQMSEENDEVFIRYEKLSSGRTKYYTLAGLDVWKNLCDIMGLSDE